MSRIAPLALVVLVACGGGSDDGKKDKSSDLVEKKLTLKGLGGKDKDGGLPVTISVPSDWKEELSKSSGDPRWKVPGGGGFMDGVSLVAFPCDEAADVCLDKVQGYQYGKEDFPEAKVEQLGPGKRFVDHDAKMKKNGKRRVHSRLFWHHAPSKNVVMCIIMLMDEHAEHAATARKICDSLKL
jgi:hypothetical protein